MCRWSDLRVCECKLCVIYTKFIKFILGIHCKMYQTEFCFLYKCYINIIVFCVNIYIHSNCSR